ncbi:aminotransferase class I/II-fold pyridoxal phosphate-dependent enzyme [Pseudomonas chlororaphis]|uniref:aminotransferase class I/II-fold pyridoxal phosphate-dependent enzyme n=1 Tax=Pseudomonas chlororaphis TaxID=587753 RepID=UPI0030D49803
MTEAHATSARNSFTEHPQPAREVFLNLNESPFGMHASVMQAAAESLAGAGRYQFDLVGRLRKAIAATHGVPEEWVSLYPGSNRALHYATLAFTGAQAPLVVATPGYPICEQTARLVERPVHQVALLENGEHDVDAMGEAGRSGLIYIANPNNPTGTLTSRSALQRLLRNLRPETHVLIDEAYLEFCDERSMLADIHDHPRLIVTRTFSKIHGMAGLRLGYAVAQPQTINHMHTMPPQDVSVPAAAAGLVCLTQDAVVSERKALIAAQRDHLKAWLAERDLPCTPSQSNCLMIDCRRPADQVISQLASRGVHVGRSWPEMPNWIRITVGNSEEMHALCNALGHTLGLTCD